MIRSSRCWGCTWALSSCCMDWGEPMNISECMKRDVVSITTSANIGQAAARFAVRHIGMLPVVDATGSLVGILQLRDLLALVMPNFVRLVEYFDFVHDFGAVESRQPS